MTGLASAFQSWIPPLAGPSTTKSFKIGFTGRTKCTRNNRRSRQVRWSSRLPEKLASISEGLRSVPEAKARYVHLTKLGDDMNSMSEDVLEPSTRVLGCNSISHIEITLQEDQLVKLRGYSDAKVSRGMVALVVLGFDGYRASDILDISTEELLSASGLQGAVGPSRINGLSSILHHVQQKVRSLQSNDRLKNVSAIEEQHPMHSRWSDRQGEDVAVLLSGGVDSSVALRRVQESGARPHAFYLKIWLDDELAHLGTCPWEEDMAYATAVCAQAGVKLTDVPFQQAYWDDVVSYTVRESRLGRTPNPDVMCNSRIKFGAFFDRIGRHYDQVVTGHYARRTVDADTGLAELRLSADTWKDQTYFLAHLSQDQVAGASFPLGELSKQEVRELARTYDLPNKERRDSQGICFLGKLKFDEFLGHHLGQRIGSIVEFETGRELGHHKGFWFYTVGQRRGVGLSGGPWYVVCKDVNQNIIYVSKEYDAEGQERNRFEFESALWIAGGWPSALSIVGAQTSLRVKTRHGPKFHEAMVTRMSADGGRVELAERDKGLAPGQFAAFYDPEDRCLGSGIISNDVSLADSPTDVVRMDASAVRLQAHL